MCKTKPQHCRGPPAGHLQILFSRIVAFPCFFDLFIYRYICKRQSDKESKRFFPSYCLLARCPQLLWVGQLKPRSKNSIQGGRDISPRILTCYLAGCAPANRKPKRNACPGARHSGARQLSEVTAQPPHTSACPGYHSRQFPCLLV